MIGHPPVMALTFQPDLTAWLATDLARQPDCSSHMAGKGSYGILKKWQGNKGIWREEKDCALTGDIFIHCFLIGQSCPLKQPVFVLCYSFSLSRH